MRTQVKLDCPGLWLLLLSMGHIGLALSKYYFVPCHMHDVKRVCAYRLQR